MEAKRIHKKDMTVGSPIKLMISFAVPILIGNVFQLLYNMVDSMVVGRFVSQDALAAVGTCNAPYSIFVALNIGSSTGVGILVAQYFGASLDDKIKNLIINAMLLISGTSIFIGGLGYAFSPKILVLLGAPEEVIGDASVYLRIMFLGLLGMGLYNIIAGTLRSIGDSRTPLYFLIFSCILNTVLDLVFVIVFKQGVFGVAIATLVSHYVSAIVTYLYARKRYPYYRFTKSDIVFDRQIINKILKAGVPLGLQNSTICLSNAILQRFVNSFGPTVMASHTIASKFDSVENLPIGAVALAFSTFIGQNIGAKKTERIKEGYKCCIIFGVCYSALIFALGHTAAEPFVRLFVSGDDIEKVIEYGVIAIGIYSTFNIFLSNIYFNRSVINGSGDTRMSMIGGFVEVIGRVGFASLYILVFKMGMKGLWYAVISNWFITGMFYLIRYLSGKWKEKSFV